MNDIFKKLAPLWQIAVRGYAKEVWRGTDNAKADTRFFEKADIFAKEYRNALERHYEKKGVKVYRGTIDGKVNEWLASQKATQGTLRVIAAGKKDKLIAEEFEKYTKEKSPDVQKKINRIFGARKDENIYKVFPFGDNFEARADQIGDDEAFALGREINEAVLSQNGAAYIWMTQQDTRVRWLHEQLFKKVFLFSDPPTTIDYYGNEHTGNPGTAWGCRCFADEAATRAKPRRGFVVRQKRKET